jgi:type IV secretion system protein VirD4
MTRRGSFTSKPHHGDKSTSGRCSGGSPEPYPIQSSWNPLLDVRLQTSHEVADTQNVSLMLIDIRGHGLDRLDHWQKAAVPLLAGMILYELYDGIATNRIPSLGDIAARFADYSANDLYEEMRDNTLLNGQPHLVVAAEGRAQLDRSDRERSSITSTLRTFFTLFTDPIVCANTSESNFRLDEIADQARPLTVFVTTLPVDTVRLRPLVRLFFTMMIRALMAPRLVYVDGQPQNPHRFNTLIAMDEFPSFGKLEEIEAALGRIAGWGGKFLLSVQDLTQLNGIYGLGHSIVANTHTRVFFPPNDLATAELLSKSTGTTTVATRHTTISGKRFGFLSQVTQSIQITSKPLMTAGEVLTMRSPTKDEAGRITAPGDVLIFLTGQPPLRTEQLLSFQDDDFAARAATPWPPVSLPAPSPPLQLPWVPAMPPP